MKLKGRIEINEEIFQDKHFFESQNDYNLTWFEELKDEWSKNQEYIKSLVRNKNIEIDKIKEFWKIEKLKSDQCWKQHNNIQTKIHNMMVWN